MASTVRVAVVLLVAAWNLSASPAVSRAALDLVRSMNATHVGVDRSGNFWFWDSTDLSVTAITPQGEHRTVDLSPDVQAIDVDRERGIVTLGDSKSVRVTSFDGAVTSSFELPFLAASLCWMDADRVAIAPSTSPWLVEVWSTSSKSAMATMGAVPEIKPPSAGAAFQMERSVAAQ